MFERTENIDLSLWGLTEQVDELWTEITDPILLKDKINEFVQTIPEFKDDSEKEYCCCCESNISSNKLTQVDGTYNFNRGKYKSYPYKLCPVCIYIAVWHEEYANYCGQKCTQDDNRVAIENKISYHNDDSNWCFVHLSVKKTSDLYCDECFYNGYPCYYCRIDERFCNT
jgi:hypothetical protein